MCVINMHGGDLEIVPHFKNRRRIFYSPGTMSGLPPTKKRSTETENKQKSSKCEEAKKGKESERERERVEERERVHE